MQKDLREQFNGRRILVTGGTGSIGREIVRQLLQWDPEVIRIFSRNENNQFTEYQKLGHHKNIRFLIGDVRDKDRLKRACEDIDYIFHTAALKHVPFCEYNPFEAVKTNVVGTQNLIEVALECGVGKVIAINTDKSVSPINTMGATKLLAEKLIIAAQAYKGTRKTSFCSVRFGNVIGSDGSVLQTFIDQAQMGGPVTVTDPVMCRFIMTIPDAVALVLGASTLSRGGEVFILKMPALKIVDLAEVIIDEIAPTDNVRITFSGSRPGEKLHEELMTREESPYAIEREGMYIIRPLMAGKKSVGSTRKVYSTESTPLMSKPEIRRYLKDRKLLPGFKPELAPPPSKSKKPRVTLYT
ncbi:polysaccharide biosynthesis protein [bacterium]|nr:polysaccharide biosynthesis protein [bacterium]